MSGCAGTMESRGYGDDKVMADYRPGQSRRAPPQPAVRTPADVAAENCADNCPEMEKKK